MYPKLFFLPTKLICAHYVHADQHGAVKIPLKYLEKLPEAIKQVIKNEKPILDLCKGQKFSLKKLLQIIRIKKKTLSID